ncbi:hypothetical protein SLS64_008184 [Diaporthe eres]|uniref:VASt domain-containing protein n=1 Tax=Diaporthe eres TaxID=83184 RepID=A0ABR1PK00_DIAER
MSDSTLGKLLRKSRSIRRGRTGSVDAAADRDADDSSVGSVSASLSRSRRSSIRRSATSDVLGDSDDGPTSPVVVYHVSADKEAQDEDPSLTSCDSEDTEFTATERPAVISNHPSQIGYLTTNNPLIQSEYYQQGSQPSQGSVTTDHLGEPDPFGSPNPVGLAPPSSQSSRRSPSPVGRLKGVFRSKKSSSKLSGGGSGASSPERRPSTAGPRLSSDITDAPKLTDPPKTDLTTDSDSDLKHAAVEERDEQQKRGSAERFRRLSRGQTIVTSTPPGTPGASEQGTPVIVNTPPTPTDSTRPKLPKLQSPPQSTVPAEDPGLGQRRGRSGSASLVPSKLSTIHSAPLTPTPENGIPTPSNPASGFFGSVLSAAQNAANTLTSTIQNTNISPGVTKNRGLNPAQSVQSSRVDDDKFEVEPSVEAATGKAMESHEPAVKTLGTGDLSLSHLGIEPTARATTPTKPSFPEQIDVNRSRSESAPAESTPIKTSGEVPWDDTQRPQSVYQGSEAPSHGDKTPPPGSLHEESTGIHRSGSIRSAIGRHNRKRGSTNGTGGTGGTGNTIGAALASANAALSQPGNLSSAPKLTGFAVASKKRNRDFHVLFKSVPDDDYLIEDYSCALQREILAHGRLYVSEGHLCFSSNILGWVTTLVMSFDEIVSVEKRSTALLFKNGLMISTLHAKHIFASFTSRDSTYDLIVKIWKLGHPELQSSLNGVRLDETGGDKTEKVDAQSIVGNDQSASASADEDVDEDESDDGDDVYDEDEDDDDVPEPSQIADPPLLESALEKSVSRKPSGAVTASLPNDKPKDAPAGAPSQDFPGPATHAPTDCGDADAHYKKIVGDDVIPAPLGKVYDLMFGPTAVTWMAKWLTVDQKCTDLQSEDKKGLTLDNRTRNYTYIKPLSGSIGPKQTKCIVSENLENLDLEKSVNILVSTQNPDVPSGNVFSVKTKYCLSWAENNATRVQINCIVEWTGKSWLKGPIENGANEGQTQYCKDLFAGLKAAVSSKARQPLAAGAGKGKKKGKKGKAAAVSNVTSDTEDAPKASSKQDWGILEPLHGILGPVVDIVKPILTGNVVYGLLVGLLVAAWFGFGFNPRPIARPYGSELGFYGYPDRLAAYEEMWRREESELWEWLEERVGMDRLNSGEMHTRKKVVEPRTMAEKLREERMDESEVKEAIRITEEKLEVLKSVVSKKA